MRAEMIRPGLTKAVTMRVPPTLQIVGGRTAAAIVSETSLSFGGKMQTVVDDTVRSARLAIDDQLPNVLVALLTPASVVALVLGLWRFTADAGWTEAFLISSGFFSHWQVWIALAIALKTVASWGNAKSRRQLKNV